MSELNDVVETTANNRVNVRVAHFVPMNKSIALAQNEPDRYSHNSPSAIFMVDLLNHLDFDFPSCAVLYGLLVRQADLGFVKASRRDLSDLIGRRVSHAHVGRALVRLESLGLLESKAHPNTTTRYRVNTDALRSLLATPNPAADVVPGLTPLPALQRIFVSDAQGDSHESLVEGSANG